MPRLNHTQYQRRGPLATRLVMIDLPSTAVGVQHMGTTADTSEIGGKTMCDDTEARPLYFLLPHQRSVLETTGNHQPSVSGQTVQHRQDNRHQGRGPISALSHRQAHQQWTPAHLNWTWYRWRTSYSLSGAVTVSTRWIDAPE